MIAGGAAVLGAALAVALGPAAADEPPAEPPGYRNDDYRARVPTTLAGATVLDVDAAERLWRAGAAVFLDVMPRIPRPSNLPAGTIWRDKRRDNIPGSLWLPNVGYGVLAPDTEAYFRRGLVTATGGDLGRTLVVYCLADCWMSWNAAKRAVSWGYTAVRWFPEGTDGWDEALLPLAPAEPAL